MFTCSLIDAGRPELALKDAQSAWQITATMLTGGEDSQQQKTPEVALAACHRLAQCYKACGKLLDAIKTYKEGVKLLPPSPQLHAALRVTLDDLPASWWGKYWSGRIEAAQAAHPLSSRDGILLRRVSPEQRLSVEEQTGILASVFENDELQLQEACDVTAQVWCQGRPPGKSIVAYFRALAYLNAGNHEQALKDIAVALVYGPRAKKPSQEGKDRSDWAAALALESSALEAKHDNLPAAISIAKALQLSPECAQYQESFQRLLRRIPEELATILSSKGVGALEAALSAQKEAAKPEYLKQRPKYYYYYEWMRKRITASHPSLPEPVMDKMLTLEAGELDLLLQYPEATSRTINRLLNVLESDGPEALETYQVPLLSWDEVQELKQVVPATLEGGSGDEQQRGRLLEASADAGSNDDTFNKVDMDDKDEEQDVASVPDEDDDLYAMD